MRRLIMSMLPTTYFLLGCFLIGTCVQVNAQETYSIPIPQDLYKYQLLENQPYVLFMTRTLKGKYYKNKGAVALADEKTGKILWSKDIDYTNSYANITRQGVVYSKYGFAMDHITSHLYDLKTGADLWKIWLMPVYFDEDADIMLGYKNPTTKTLECYQLSSGKKLWETELDHHNNEIWNNVQCLDKDHILITANNFCQLNIKTGALSIQEAKTAVQDVKMGTIQGVAATLGILFAGCAVVPTAGNVFTSLVSNMLTVGDKFYVSDRTHLVCLDKEWNEVWHCDFPAKAAGHARLFCKGDSIFMLNEGYGLKLRNKVMLGKPFFAAFNKNTGENFFLKMLPEKWDEDKYGKILDFAKDTLYLMNRDKSIVSPIINDGHVYPIFTLPGDVDFVNDQLEVVKEYPGHDVYGKGSQVGEYFIVGQWGKHPDLYLVDNKGNIKSQLDLKYANVRIKGDKLYYEKDNQLFMEDTSQILK